ncbi:MAG: hypothetical protein ABIT71_25940 [Vicinamibacteraceae bacterium]
MVRLAYAALLAAIVISPTIAAAQPVPPVRLSVSTAGTEANGYSATLAVSRDGRHVLFSSTATNLVAGDTNTHDDIFIRDRDTDRDGIFDEAGAAATIRVNQGLAGEQSPDGFTASQMSADGRFVLWVTAGALVPEDTNGVVDVYLRDRDADGDGIFDEPGAVIVERVSTGTGNAQTNADSFTPSMTPDARFILFSSRASNLHPIASVPAQFYRKDRLTTVTTIVTARPDGTPGNTNASSAVLSADGRYAAFAGAFVDPDPLPAGARWVLRDLTLNTFVPIAQPSTAPSALPVTEPRAPRVADPLIITNSKVIGFSPDGVRLLVAATTTGILGSFVNHSGAIYDYDVAASQIVRSFPGIDDTQFMAGTRANIDRSIGIAYAEAAGTLGSCPPEGRGRFIYDRRTGRVTQLVGGGIGQPASSLDGRRLLYWHQGNCVGELPTPSGTFLWDAGYDVPLPMPDPVRAGWMDAAGTMAIFDTTEATILTAGADANGVSDVFAVDLVSRLDRDTDGLDDRWEVSMGLDYTSSAGANGAAGDPDTDGVTNLQELAAGTHPRGTARQFLAEGADNAFFKTRLAIANPGTTAATAVVRLDGDDGTAKTVNVHVPAAARRTVFVDEVGDHAPSFATVVDSSAPLVSERTMSWDATEYGAHAERASAAPATSWFLAEGATGSFSLFYLLQNPGSAAAIVTVRYLRPAPLAPIERSYSVAAHARVTLPVNEQAPELAATDVSAAITSDVPILVERAMYRTVGGQPFAAGHASAGVTAAATSWFLAEGATGNFFDMFVLLANPNSTAAEVEVRYLLTTGEVLTKTYTVAPESRRTIYVDDETFPGVGQALVNTTLSCAITSTNAVPIVVERSMWFPGPAITPVFWTEANNSAGTTATATRWVLADGESGGTRDTQTFVLIANTSSTPGRVRLTRLPDTPAPFDPSVGVPLTVTVDLPANSRTTVPLHATGGFGNVRYGVIVESIETAPLAQLVVERAMYWNAGGVVWAAGTNLLATPVP